MKFEVKNRYSHELQFTAEIECDESTKNSVKLGLAVKWAIKNDANLDGANLDGANLMGASLDGASLICARLDGANLVGANLDGARLNGANLVDASLICARLVGANLDGANLNGARLIGACLEDANLNRANLVDANLICANLVGADLVGARLNGASLIGANLICADLVGARLNGANLMGANLDGANLNGARLDDKTIRIFKHDLWGILLRFKNEIPELINYIKEGKINGSCYSGDCTCLMGTFAKIKATDKTSNSSGDEFSLRDSKSPIEQWFMTIKPGDTPENNYASKKALEWIEEFLRINNWVIYP